MSEGNDMLRCAEYSTLRDELLQNKKYVFERPLLIIGAAGIASVQLSGQPSFVFPPLLLSIVLLVNLWFTVNRLRSSARIAAYIAAVLEPASGIKWIGWENSLRLYRIWKKKNNPEQQEERQSKYIDKSAFPDAMMFYSPLWLLHVVTTALALPVSLASVCQTPGLPSRVVFAATAVVSAVFAWYCLKPCHPKEMRGLIEIDRVTWLAVFEENV